MNRNVLLCLLLALVTASLFIADWKGLNKKVGKPVASIAEIEGTVKKMSRGSLTWDRCFSKTVLEEGDTLVTGDGAYARVEFYDGGELELDEGAMVVVVQISGDLQLNIMSGRGKLRIANDSKSKIQVAHGKVQGVSEKPTVEVEYVDQIKNRPREEFKKIAAPRPAVNKLMESESDKKTQTNLKPLKPQLEIGGGYRTLAIDYPNDLDPKKGLRFEVLLKPLGGKESPKTIFSFKRKIRVGDLTPGKYNWSVRLVGKGRLPASEIGLKIVRDYQDANAPSLKPVMVEQLKPQLNPVKLGEEARQFIDKPRVK